MNKPFQYLFRLVSISYVGRTVVFLLAVFCAYVAITYFFPGITGLQRTSLNLFVIAVLGLIIFPHASKNDQGMVAAKNTLREIGRTPIPPILGTSVIVALILGTFIQAFFFPEVTRLPGIIGDFAGVVFPLMLVGIVLIFSQRKR